VKVTVDAERCRGHARCALIAPDVFDIDDEGYSTVLCAVVPTELEEKARRAATNCPEGAITVD
jgi:ferredoxin